MTSDDDFDCSPALDRATNSDSGSLRKQPNSRTSACRQCGGNPHAIVNAFKAGIRAGIWESYRDNIQR